MNRKFFRYPKQVSLLVIQLLLLFTYAGCQPVEENIEVTLYGAAGQVSGSMTKVTSGNFDLLIDAGLYYPEGEGSYQERSQEAEQLNATIPFNARDIEAVAITHGHLDHIGRLPNLIREGFRGDVYVTEGTYAIIEVMLDNQVRYDDTPRKWVYSESSINSKEDGEPPYVTGHWNYCQWQERISIHNKQHYHGKRSESVKEIGIEISPCKVCTKKALEELLSKVNFVKLPYGEKVTLDRNKSIKFLNAAHIPGSATVYLTFSNSKGASKRLLFSGDVGKSKNVLQNGFAPAPEADMIWIENTYGGIVRDMDLNTEMREFQMQLAEGLQHGGIVWIPAFALDRTQQVLHLIQLAKINNIIDEDVKVYVPSPSGADFTDLYIDELKFKSGWFKDEIYRLQYPFAYQERYLPDYIPPSSIVITTSGMMESVFSSNLLDDLLPETSTTVLTVGYQDPDTPGGQLRSGESEIKWDDTVIPVKAKHLKFSFFSGHADAKEMQDWLSNQDKSKAHIYLMHGEENLIKDQKNMLNTAEFDSVFIPRYGETFTFDYD